MSGHARIALVADNCTSCMLCVRECPDVVHHAGGPSGARRRPRGPAPADRQCARRVHASTGACACTAASASRSARSTRSSGGATPLRPRPRRRAAPRDGPARGVRSASGCGSGPTAPSLRGSAGPAAPPVWPPARRPRPPSAPRRRRTPRAPRCCPRRPSTAPRMSWLRSPIMTVPDGGRSSRARASVMISDFAVRRPSSSEPTTVVKYPVRAKCSRIESANTSALEVATASVRPAARRLASSSGIPSYTAVLVLAVGGVVLPVGRDRDRHLGGIEATEVAERVEQGRADEPPQLLVVEGGLAHRRQGVAHRADDPRARLGQRPVEVEQDGVGIGEPTGHHR